MPYMGELVGTMLLVLLGDSIVANVVLNKTKGNNSGWIVITVGWSMAVMIPAYMFGTISGSHFNPVLTIALAVAGSFPWAQVPGYILCQMLGGFIGACLVYLFYKDHFDETPDGDTKLAVFCTGPAIRNIPLNFVCELIATFVLVFGIMMFGTSGAVAGLNTFGVGGLILVLGCALGGTTGYALNPARDLSPRLAHFILPIKQKRDPDWAYSWIPVCGPLVGAVLGALAANLFLK